MRDKIAEWYPDVPKLEMFCRLKRPGWSVFGNDVEYDLLSGPLGGGGRGVSVAPIGTTDSGSNDELSDSRPL